MAAADETKLIAGADLRKLLSSALSVLGEASMDMLIREMEKQGIVFDNKSFYTLGELKNTLMEIFEEETAELLLKRISRENDK